MNPSFTKSQKRNYRRGRIRAERNSNKSYLTQFGLQSTLNQLAILRYGNVTTMIDADLYKRYIYANTLASVPTVVPFKYWI